MKIYRPIVILWSLIIIACLSGVQGQYITASSSSISSAASSSTPLYATPTVLTPYTYYSAPGQIGIVERTPPVIYLGTQLQAVPYTPYQSSANSSGGNQLWVKEITNLTQYEVISLGTTVQLLAISPNGGNGYITDIQPNGVQYSKSFYFYPRSQLPFYADQVGQHVLTFNIDNQISNSVTIVVTGPYLPSYGYVPPSYYPDYRFGGYWPGHYYAGSWHYWRKSWLDAP